MASIYYYGYCNGVCGKIFQSLCSVEAEQFSGVTVPTVIFLILLCAFVPSIEMLIAFNSVPAYSQKGSIITPNV